ncbi:MAG TPA: DUF1207 domain-containing protein [Tepidisphaeraceae bacterium]|jgi:hypothetical protein
MPAKPCLVVAVASVLWGSTVLADDGFIRGYAAAILEREFALRADEMTVENGVLSYPDRAFGTLEKQQLVKSLGAVPGVKEVRIVNRAALREANAAKPQAASDGAGPVAPGSASAATGTSSVGADVDVPIVGPLSLYLSPGRLFEPLLADPRWPHFYASYNNYIEDADAGFEHVGGVGFGETISIVRKTYDNDLRWEAGVQAGVFAIFDLDSDSADLINADYFGGPYYALRFEDLSLLARVYHQSSHLGDEFLLRDDVNQDDRVNVSYEAVDLLLSYELPLGFRAYGGAGYLFHRNPGEIDPLYFQYGAEFRSPWLVPDTTMRPVFAADLQNREESDYDTDYSLRAGVQFEDPARFSQRMLIMLEYYDGRSPNGQFYTDRVRFLGVGLHFYF